MKSHIEKFSHQPHTGGPSHGHPSHGPSHHHDHGGTTYIGYGGHSGYSNYWGPSDYYYGYNPYYDPYIISPTTPVVLYDNPPTVITQTLTASPVIVNSVDDHKSVSENSKSKDQLINFIYGYLTAFIIICILLIIYFILGK